MRRALTATVAAAAFAVPAGNAAATALAQSKPKAKPKRRVVTVTKRVAGSEVYAGRWGPLRVTLVVKKTTTIVGAHRTVKRTIVGLDVPVYPDHTDRSVFINQQALPLLEQEALQAHYSPNVDLISGATDTSMAFVESLQSALLKARSI